MFRVGDCVVYPMHGAGLIKGIEQKKILGKTHRYYVLHLPVSDMKVMIPVDNIDGTGLRNIIESSKVDEVLDILGQEPTSMSSNWNRRYRKNLEKIRSGDIFEVAGVVKNLAARDRERGLATTERKMLENAKEILLSEIILATNWDEEKATGLVEEILE